MKHQRPFTLILLAGILLALLPSCKTGQKALTTNKAKGESTAMSPEYRQLHETFMDALIAKTQGNTEKALALFQTCLTLDPANAAAMYELAQLYAAKDLRSEALRMAENAGRLEPGNAWYLYLHAQLLQTYNRFSEAIPVFEKLQKLNPDKSEFILQAADNYVMAGKLNEALKAYDRVEKKMGVQEAVSLQKQKIYLHQGKQAEAIKELEKLIAAFPSETRYYTLLADVYSAAGQEAKAAGIYEKALLINPEDPYIHLALYDFYSKTGNKEKAEQEMLFIFGCSEVDIDTKIQILLSFFAVGNENQDMNRQVGELLAALKKAHPEDPKVYSIEGDFLYRDQKITEAAAAFRKVISLDSSRYVVWEQLIRIEGEQEQYREVLNLCRRAIDLFPEQPVPYMFAGISCLQEKEYETAIKYFNQCRTLIVDNDELLINVYAFLGDTYYQVKNHTLSDENYDHALKIRYDNAYVLNNYSYYLSLRGEKLEKAEKMARHAVDMNPDNPTYLDTYAWVLYKSGKYSEALTVQEKALRNKGSENPVLLEHYGDILYKLNRTVEAMEYWKKAQSAGKGSEFLDSKINQKKLIE